LLAGLGIGMALSVVASSVVPGVRAADPVAMSVVILAIALLCAVALIVPVHQLLRGAPMQRLRDE
jgi:hypothetical protein